MTKWIGPAAWSAREARAGDRLPYARHLDDHTIELRSGAAMRTLHVPGVAFETEDADALNQMLAVREVMLRAALDARFVLYHHVVRRRVRVELEAVGDPLSAEIGRHWNDRLADRHLFVNEQFLTLVRRPARGKTGWPERLARLGRRASGTSADPADLRALDAAATALLAALAPYGARPLGSYEALTRPARSRSSCCRHCTMARCVRSRRRARASISGSTSPMRASASGSIRSRRGSPGTAASRRWSAFANIPMRRGLGSSTASCASPTNWC